MWTYLESAMNGGDFIADEINWMEDVLLNSKPEATKLRTYLTLNLQLKVHPLYTK